MSHSKMYSSLLFLDILVKLRDCQTCNIYKTGPIVRFASNICTIKKTVKHFDLNAQ